MSDAQDETMPQEASMPNASAPQPKAGAAGPDAAQSPGRPNAGSAPREARAPFKPREENTIFIGRKSTMGYVLAVVTQFQHGSPFVKVKARGKLISMAVDVAEIARRRFLPDVKVGGISIQTEDLENEDGSRSKVSSIEITLTK